MSAATSWSGRAIAGMTRSRRLRRGCGLSCGISQSQAVVRRVSTAVPTYAHWQLADMPGYLSTEQVNRLIAAGDGDAGARRPDRAIVLLLVRLGLRAGDAAQLRLTEIEWQTGSLRKPRYEVRLPLPQDVGDATAAYRDCLPSTRRNDVLFLRRIAPCRPFRRGDGICRW